MRIVMDAVNTILFHNPSIPMIYSLVLKKYGYIVDPDKISETRKKMLIKKSMYEGVCRCNDADVTYRKKWNYLTTLIIKELGIPIEMMDKIANEIHFEINDEHANVENRIFFYFNSKEIAKGRTFDGNFNKRLFFHKSLVKIFKRTRVF